MKAPAIQTRPDQAYLSKDLEKHLHWYSANNVTTVGNTHVADGKKLAFFCSKKCPGSLIIQTHDLAHAVRDVGVTIIGGFHSPVEQECLTVLLKGTQPLIICPPRSLDGMRLPTPWRTPIQQDRLLILSPFHKRHRRATSDLARKRNEFVAALADAIFIPYASPGGITERLCRKALSWKKRLLTFRCPENHNLIQLGVEPVEQPPIDRFQAQAFWFRDCNGT